MVNKIIVIVSLLWSILSEKIAKSGMVQRKMSIKKVSDKIEF